MKQIDYQDNLLRLPSGGLAYDPEMVRLPQNDSVLVGRWKTEHEREIKGVIKSQDTHRVFKWLLERILIQPSPISTDLDQFLISDVLIIMHMVKIWTYGPVADFPYECRCRAEQNPSVDLGSLLVKYADDVPDYKAEGIECTVEGRKLLLHLPRLSDEKTVQSALREMQRARRVIDDDTDRGYLRTAILIDEIDGKPERSWLSKFNFLMGLDLRSVEHIQETLIEADTGIDLDQVEVYCTSCDRKSIIGLGLSPDFFRPPVARSNDNGKEGPARSVQKHQHGHDSQVDDSRARRGDRDLAEASEGRKEAARGTEGTGQEQPALEKTESIST